MYNPSSSVTRLAVCQWQIAVSVSEGSLAISVTSLVRQHGGSGARPQIGGARVGCRAPRSGLSP